MHCGVCNQACDPQQACENNSCISARRVFATDATFGATFGGVGGADAECQSAASAAGLGGNWLAFIFQNGNGYDRYEQAMVPFVRLDGVRIADDWIDLIDDSVQATLNVSETLQTVTGNVWTGLSQNGVGASDCSNWTTNEDTCVPGQSFPCGGAGESDQVNFHWDGWYIFSCAEACRLYCIEQ